MKIWYDSTMLNVLSCSKSGHWNDKSFEYNIDSVPGEIIFGGTGGNTEGTVNRHYE